MKKILAIVLVIAFGTLILVACSKDTTPSSSTAAPPQSETTVSSQQASSASSESAAEPSSTPVLTENLTIPTELPGTSILADFQKPEYLHYVISNIAYDEETETYAILYAVSNYDGNKDWLTYQEDNSQLAIQLFDKQGAFLQRIDTDLDPITDSDSDVLPSEPCVFNDGMLSFFAGFPNYYIFFDIANETYAGVRAERCTTDGDYFLFDNGGATPNGYTGEYVYSFYHVNHPIASISIQIDDPSFQMPGNRSYEGEKADLFSLDSQAKTAIVGNDKLVYYLDFNTETWTMERSYTREHLERLIATSPDGRWEIYLADTGGAGDGHWADIVSLETSSGAITYLTDYYSISAIFASENLLLINKTLSIELIDVEKGEVIDKEFAIDCAQKDCYINGIAYDANNDWLLVAWRSPRQSSEEKLPLMLDIYTLDGELVKSMDTGYEIIPFYKNYVVDLTLELDGNGSVAMIRNPGTSYAEVIGSVKYD